MPRFRISNLAHGYGTDTALEQCFESSGIIHLRFQGQQSCASAQVRGIFGRRCLDGHHDVAVECFGAVGQTCPGGGVAIVRIVDKDAGALLYTHFDAVFADDGGGFGCQRQTSVAHGCRDAESKVALA